MFLVPSPLSWLRQWCFLPPFKFSLVMKTYKLKVTIEVHNKARLCVCWGVGHWGLCSSGESLQEQTQNTLQGLQNTCNSQKGETHHCGKSAHPEEKTDGHCEKMGKKANSGPESIWKRNRNGFKTCRKCSLFFIWEMFINNGTRIPFSLMKGAQVEKLEESSEWGTF